MKGWVINEIVVVDGGGKCEWKGNCWVLDSVHGVLQVDAITYPSTTVVSASSLLIEWST